MATRYQVLWTGFHAAQDEVSPYDASEEIYSEHRTYAAAERAVAKYRNSTECTCGCLVIVEEES